MTPIVLVVIKEESRSLYFFMADTVLDLLRIKFSKVIPTFFELVLSLGFCT